MKTKNNERNQRANMWWTEELTQHRRKTNSLRRRYQRSQTYLRTNHREQYLMARTDYQNLLKTQKIKSWQQFITKSTQLNPWGQIYKISKGELYIEKVN
jgi:ribosomal protein S12 methylthiotransferase accessory factor YcaO